MHSLRQRINTRDESGFTLIELLVVLIIIGILLAIAVPSYLGFRDKAQQTSAAANVREAIPGVEAFYSDNNTYAGIGDTANGNVPSAALLGYDSGMAKDLTVFGNATKYCISESGSKYGTHIAKVVGPGGTVQTDKDVPTLAACAAATG
ncbi:MAG TPA: prepilin-type N-terminal cleavage/methylation domain-containing protein [Gaiellaceae bacterium]|nr:prepilin-type N-terminal cleavage/methylation domain-containing protein [Gaiellaceae bacterium]